jgi:hypothetical protein
MATGGVTVLIAAVIALILLVGAHVLQHRAAALDGEVAMDPATAAAAEEAKQRWRRQSDLVVLRIVTTQIEEFGIGQYRFAFDVYHAHGIAKAFATTRGPGVPGEGGMLSTGGLFGLADSGSSPNPAGASEAR